MAQKLQEAIALYESLKKDFATKTPNLVQCGANLDKLKVLLTLLSATQFDQKQMLLTRK